MSNDAPYRWSLRAMFVLVALVACWLAWGLAMLRSEQNHLTFVVLSTFLGGQLLVTLATRPSS